MKPRVIHKIPTRHIGGMTKLKGNTLPHEFLFFDTETHIRTNDNVNLEFPLRLGVAVYVNTNKDNTINKRIALRFNTAKDFVDILKTYAKGRKSLYVFAHNIKFDIMVLNLPFALFDNGIVTRYPIINDRMFIWRFKIDKANVILVDTANYGVISVEQLGKDLGYPKLNVDFNNVTDDELAKYCLRDVEILETFMHNYVQFIHDNSLGSFKLTLASQSLTSWRTRFMRKTVHIHDDEKALKLERSAYHGGRTEAFYIGTAAERPYYYLDVNSMYPHVMKSSVVPNKLLYTVDSPSLAKFELYVKAHYVIADVELDTDENAYPYVANDKLLFPLGKFRTVLHHKELSYALKRGHITKVHSIALYEFANLFGYYVDFFYDLKQRSKHEGNKSWYLISKLFQNSLYGKMAQTGVKQEIVIGDYERIISRTEGHKLGTFDYSNEVNWFGTIIREKREGESSYSFPACAGAITANARMLLYNYICVAGIDNVLYCDTDSLITNYEGFYNLRGFLDDYELGKLKLEKESHYLTIYGNKDYEFGDILRHKGISPKAEQLSRNKWRTLQFDGILSYLNAGGNKPATARYMDKRRLESYNKGIVDNKTGKVTPLTF
jgi:DNA polymerase family B